MFDAFLWLQNDRTFEFLLIVSLGVSVTSGTAWVVSRHLRNAALRHLVLLSALVNCLATPAITSLCAGVELTFVSIPVLSAAEQRLDLQRNQNDSSCACGKPCALSALQCSPLNWAMDAPVGSSIATVASPTGLATAPPLESEEPPSGSSATWQVRLREMLTVGILIWGLGTLITLTRFLGHCGCAVQLRRSSRPAQAKCQILLQEVANQLDVRSIPSLFVTSRSISPLAIGLGRPAVILPERLMKAFTDEEIRDVLAHEVAHLKRGDQWIVLLQELAAALYWPIVFVHGLNRELWRTREELCDEAVIASRDPISYSETLYHVAELLLLHRPVPGAVGMFGRRGELERRISRLINQSRDSSTVTGRTSLLIVASLFIASSVTTAGVQFVAASSNTVPASAGVMGRVPAPDATGAIETETRGDLIAVTCCPS